MSDKVLATFRIDPDEWEEFKSKASQNSTNASAMLLKLVRSYLAGNPLSNTEPDTVPNNIDERLNRLDSIEERLRTVADRLQLASTAPAVNLELDNVNSKVTEELVAQKVKEHTDKLNDFLEGWVKRIDTRFNRMEERLSQAEKLNKPVQVQVHEQEINGQLEEVDKKLFDLTDVLAEIHKLIDEYNYDSVRDRTLNKLKVGKQSAAGKAIEAFIRELRAENQENTEQI